MFCSDAVKQGVQDKDSRSISRDYIHGPSGMNIPFNEKECNDQMNSISDNCDGNDPSSPRNYKGDETPTIGEKNSLPNELLGACGFRDKFAIKSFWIWGPGRETSEHGKRDGDLYQELKKCNKGDELEDRNFSYGHGSDKREWTAVGKLWYGRSDCIQTAIENAGGLKGVKCSRDL
ncbi:uncharacterized protein MCYG_07503 [Microsporum canis CBS 113480]|uniref:Uncharacterized protein n=1 Tax=Arthroderma otae (strain ATCC MYA-4605 / CBS 113480) TaxID=554155 RepID=C5FYT6_ARTOC|nr:uncharacterized protein MCYG_07503 [Microsporum canis CBS 113480]EEQ34684.1 predicted protein [Microsporum canis CBS 113480]